MEFKKINAKQFLYWFDILQKNEIFKKIAVIQ